MQEKWIKNIKNIDFFLSIKKKKHTQNYFKDSIIFRWK